MFFSDRYRTVPNTVLSFLILSSVLLLYSQVSLAADSPKINPRERTHLQAPKINDDVPNVEIGVHNIGNTWLTVSNRGQFGTVGGAEYDPITGMTAPSCVFPAGSDLNYLYAGAFWIGAIVGRDTLVSVGIDDSYSVEELWPSPYDGMTRRSIQNGNPYFSLDAKSEQDIIAIYSDQLTDPAYVSSDSRDGRPHKPLNIQITQRSYAWSYAYAQDFILFDYSIMNIGNKELNDVYMGVWVDGDVHHESLFGPEGYGEDLCGYKESSEIQFGDCVYLDSINLAYITDNNGDPDDQVGGFNANSARGAAGVRVVRTPSDSLELSFNWWVTDYGGGDGDFGPRMAGTEDDPFREMGVLGTPFGDANKYYIMRHEEFDYDQLFTAKDHTAEGWLQRPSNAAQISFGYDARYMLSFGPFDISPGEVLPVTFAWILGDNIHVDADDFENLYDPNIPELYFDTWDFEDISLNARWASWIYDNPGYDTDGDGYKGKFIICAYDSIFTDTTDNGDDSIWVHTRADTFYYQGDGIPDFRGASPPPAPELWIVDPNGDTLGCKFIPRIVEHNQGEISVRWNGLFSETTLDVFSNKIDFEGYRIYLDDTPDFLNHALIASYDLEDYNRFIYNPQLQDWELNETPFTIDSLKTIYGNDFVPEDYYRESPLFHNDTAFYFAAQDFNQSELRDVTMIHKRYPDDPPPTISNLDSARIYHPEELTDDGLFFRYYEYEYILTNLLPSRPYYIAVTAFDYGSPSTGLTSLETQPRNNYICEYPQPRAGEYENRELNVNVFPNPYRIDGHYREQGFEGLDYIDNQGNLRRQEGLIDERTRAIHFTNLPPRCTIRIFSIDADLIRRIEHDVPAEYPQSGHEQWDLITRNTQAIVSGIYYYSVESEQGTQIGKIVVIM